jgi:hypothetical protein
LRGCPDKAIARKARAERRNASGLRLTQQALDKPDARWKLVWYAVRGDFPFLFSSPGGTATDMFFDQQHSLWRGIAILSFAGFGSLG